MSSIPMRWRDWFNTARLCYELRELRQGWAQYERIHDALIGRYETKIAALEAENARLKEALRECLNSLCEYVDVDSPGKMSDRKGRGQKAVARACEVLGDA